MGHPIGIDQKILCCRRRIVSDEGRRRDNDAGRPCLVAIGLKNERVIDLINEEEVFDCPVTSKCGKQKKQEGCRISRAGQNSGPSMLILVNNACDDVLSGISVPVSF